MENTLSPLSQALDKVSDEGLVLTMSRTSEGNWRGTLYGPESPVEVIGTTIKDMLEAAGVAAEHAMFAQTQPQ